VIVTRYKKIIPYALVLGVAIIFLLVRFAFLSSAKTNLVDLSSLPLKIINFPIQELKKILSYHFTYNQNLILRSENAALMNKLVELEEFRQENERLKNLFNFKRDSNYSFIVARVIGRDPTNWSSSVIIDRGQRHGIQANMCCVTEAGVVGKVLEAGEVTSKVMLINDPNSSVASLIQRSREQGIISGTITGQCRLHFLPGNSDVKASDIIITSGLGGVYPKGLVIGRVVEIEDETGGLSRSCRVKPAANLSGLEEILIMSR
jgi:rod shape-determining protein MreC